MLVKHWRNLGKNMVYKVILSDLAKRQLDNILFYIYATLGNETAAARKDRPHSNCTVFSPVKQFFSMQSPFG